MKNNFYVNNKNKIFLLLYSTLLLILNSCALLDNPLKEIKVFKNYHGKRQIMYIFKENYKLKIPFGKFTFDDKNYVIHTKIDNNDALLLNSDQNTLHNEAITYIKYSNKLPNGQPIPIPALKNSKFLILGLSTNSFNYYISLYLPSEFKNPNIGLAIGIRELSYILPRDFVLVLQLGFIKQLKNAYLVIYGPKIGNLGEIEKQAGLFIVTSIHSIGNFKTHDKIRIIKQKGIQKLQVKNIKKFINKVFNTIFKKKY